MSEKSDKKQLEERVLEVSRLIVICKKCGNISKKGKENLCMLCLQKDTQIPIERINELSNNINIMERNMGERFGDLSEDTIMKLIKFGINNSQLQFIGR